MLSIEKRRKNAGKLISHCEKGSFVYHGTIHERREAGPMASHNGNTNCILLNKGVPMLVFHCRRNKDEPLYDKTVLHLG